MTFLIYFFVVETVSHSNITLYWKQLWVGVCVECPNQSLKSFYFSQDAVCVGSRQKGSSLELICGNTQSLLLCFCPSRSICLSLSGINPKDSTENQDGTQKRQAERVRGDKGSPKLGHKIKHWAMASQKERERERERDIITSLFDVAAVWENTHTHSDCITQSSSHTPPRQTLSHSSVILTLLRKKTRQQLTILPSR